jgi:hypothetical protein
VGPLFRISTKLAPFESVPVAAARPGFALVDAVNARDERDERDDGGHEQTAQTDPHRGHVERASTSHATTDKAVLQISERGGVAHEHGSVPTMTAPPRL